MSQKNIAVIGAGVAGVFLTKMLARRLKKTNAKILLFNNIGHEMTLQSVIPQVAVNSIPAKGARYNLHRLFKTDKNVQIVPEEVIQIKNSTPMVFTKKNRFKTDYNIIATGNIGADYDIPGVGEHTTIFTTFDSAIKIRQDLQSFVDQQRDLPEQIDKKPLDITIVGGGASGVELTAELIDFKKRNHFNDRVKLTLINANFNLLQVLGEPDLSQKTQELLEKNDVRVLNNSRVIGITKDKITLMSGQQLDIDKVYWASGLKGSPALNQWQLAINDEGRITVDEFFHVLDETGDASKNVFAAGNVASFAKDSDLLLRQSEIDAEIAGKVITDQIAYEFGVGPAPQSYRNRRKLFNYFVSLGQYRGVSTTFWQRASFGPLPRLAKHVVNLYFFLQMHSWYGVSHYLRYAVPFTKHPWRSKNEKIEIESQEKTTTVESHNH